MSDEFDFDAQGLAPWSAPVKYRGSQYVLKEPDAGAVAAWEAEKLRGATLTEGGGFQLGNVAAASLILVSRCLYGVKTGQDGKPVINPDGSPVLYPVTLAFVQGIAGHAARKMFDKLVEVGQLRTADETPESLTAEIQKLSERRSKLLAGDTAPKGPPEPSTATSG